MKTITSIVAAIAVDEADQMEGICAYRVGDAWLPLVAADEERYDQIRQVAELIADSTGGTVKMVRFTERTEIMEIQGRKQ